ncbi:hypothetical protein [Kribbella soli]|uniref:DUF3592 domain-containing protein n=1 Tax=Kribbella soli TaxID=1124743 RepID=A0A4R0HL32_9ACTN|nr:hypothetical protein [Kribbella soli]TCC08469.1 hypothetical protein E0H45_21585 [Kribbella soli]
MSTGKQRSGELWVLLQTRRLGFGRNPLRRWSDRAETALLWCAVIAALLLAPAGAAVGTGVRDSLNATAAQQRAVLHEVSARTLGSTERMVPSAPGDVLSRARVSYTDPQGVDREATASVAMGTKAGVEVTIWIDSSGSIVTAPRSRSDSAAFGVAAGIFTVLGSWLLLWGLFGLARLPLDRRRSRDWDAEWDTVAPRWLHGQK